MYTQISDVHVWNGLYGSWQQIPTCLNLFWRPVTQFSSYEGRKVHVLIRYAKIIADFEEARWALSLKFRLHIPNASNSAFVLLVCLTASCLPVAHPSGLPCAADPYWVRYSLAVWTACKQPGRNDFSWEWLTQIPSELLREETVIQPAVRKLQSVRASLQSWS